MTPNGVGTTVVTITFLLYFQPERESVHESEREVVLRFYALYRAGEGSGCKAGWPQQEADAKRFRNYVNSTSSSKGAVYIWCEANLNDHGAWFDYLTEVPNGYSFGEVVRNDGRNSNAPVSDYPWMCIMTVNHNAYLNAYNKELGARSRDALPEIPGDHDDRGCVVLWRQRLGIPGFERAGVHRCCAWKKCARNSP